MTREELAALPLHDRIAAVIEASGMGQEQFAQEVGFTREAVNRWVNGAPPRVKARAALAVQATRVFGFTASPDLFRPRPPEDSFAELSRVVERLAGIVPVLTEIQAALSRIEAALPRSKAGNTPS